MKAIALLAAGLLMSMCSAQHDDYFPDIPSNHWVFETLLRLHKENVIDSPLTLFFRGGAPPRRMEIANWAVHASSVMISRLEDAERAKAVGEDSIGGARAQAAWLDKLTKETDNLAKMAFLFEPELKRRFIDAMALRRELLAFPMRLERILGPAKQQATFAITPGSREAKLLSTSADDDFVVTDENRWVIAALWDLQAEGILVGYRPFKIENDPHQARTRYVLAMATHSAFLRLKEIRDKLKARIDAVYRDVCSGADPESFRAELTSLKEQVEGLSGYDKNVRDLVKLSHYFYKELALQGVDHVAMRRELADMTVRYCSGFRSFPFTKNDPRVGVKNKPGGRRMVGRAE